MLACVFGYTRAVHAEVYTDPSTSGHVTISIPIWAFVEPQPGVMTQQAESPRTPPRQTLRELGEFVLGGAVYGWRFSYTPKEKKRAVMEHFTLTPIFPLPPDSPQISLRHVRTPYPYIHCRAEYSLDARHATHMRQSRNLTYQRAQGRGRGERKEELKGVYHAYHRAIVDALRKTVRKTQKNKPKEVEGMLYVKDNPRLFVEAGEFVAELSLSVHFTKITPYSVY